MLLEHASQPFAPHADSAGNAHRAVDNEQLSVVARHEPEPTAKSGGVEHGGLDTALSDTANEFARRSAAADPVEASADLDPPRAGFEQGVRNSPTHLIGAEDIALQGDAGARALDQGQHRLERRRAVAQQLYAVAARDVSRCNAPQSARKGGPGNDGQRRVAPVKSELTTWSDHNRARYRNRALAKSLRARNPERREIPNGAKCHTARNPKQRGIPEGGHGAESQTARSARGRLGPPSTTSWSHRPRGGRSPILPACSPPLAGRSRP